MKPIALHPVLSILLLSAASLLIMLLIDRLLGARAEYLNAWSLGCQWFGSDPGIPPCTIQKQFGIIRASLLVLLVNTGFGLILFAILKGLRVLA